MFEYLSEVEKYALGAVKEWYDINPSKTIVKIELKHDIKTKGNVMISLQEKGYWEINKKDLGKNMELISITLREKFFEYFNI